MNYAKAPKIELHLHLDCSLSYDVVKKIDTTVTYEQYAEAFIAPPKCTDLADFLTRAIKGVDFMQTKDQLILVTSDLFDQLLADNVIYAEIRFAPLQHLNKGLSAEDVVSIVCETTRAEIERTGIEAGIILCTLRHFSEEQSMRTVRLAETFKNEGVVGFDIASDEAGYPIDNHIKSFEYARKHTINCTAHAGEAKGADSVWETLNHLCPQRIGHGVRSVEDPSLLNHLVHKNIHLEICPTSNIQTNIFEEIKDHSVDTIYRSGVSLSINTDARTISDVTLAIEYERLEKTFQWSREHFKRCNLEAINHAFTSPEIKERLRQKILNAYGP